MSEVLEFFKTLFQTGKEYYAGHIVVLIIVGIIALGLAAFAVISMNNALGGRGGFFAKILMLFYFSLSVATILLVITNLWVGGDILDSRSSLYGKPLFITMIAAAVLLFPVQLLAMKKGADDMDAEKGMLTNALRTLILVAALLLFIFTDFKGNLLNWDFKIFGLKVGRYLFLVLMSWGLSRIGNLIAFIVAYLTSRCAG